MKNTVAFNGSEQSIPRNIRPSESVLLHKLESMEARVKVLEAENKALRLQNSELRVNALIGKTPPIPEDIERICSYITGLAMLETGVPIDKMKKKTRAHKVVRARGVCYFLFRKFIIVSQGKPLSLNRCSDVFGGQHHSTVKGAIEIVEIEIKSSRVFLEAMERLCAKVAEFLAMAETVGRE